MTSPRPSYFLVPDFAIAPPPNGPLTLGTIVSNACFPAQSVISTAPTESSFQATNENHPMPYPQVRTAPLEKAWSTLRNSTASTKSSLWTRFLSLVDLSADTHSSREQWSYYRAKSLTTTFILPNPDYVAQRAQEEMVNKIMQSKRYGKHKAVYMITGLKVAKKLEISTRSEVERGGNVSTSVDATEVSGGTAPVGAGFGVGKTKGREEKGETKLKGDVVFAYQISKMQLVRKTEVSFEIERKGTFLSIEEGKREEERSELSVLESVGGRGKEALEGEVDTEDVEMEVEEVEEGCCVIVRKL